MATARCKGLEPQGGAKPGWGIMHPCHTHRAPKKYLVRLTPLLPRARVRW